MSLEVKVYEKENNKSLFKLFRETLTDFKASLYLSRQLAVRDIKAQYRQSYFGILWAFITPLTTAIVWIFLNGTGTIKLSDTGVPYPVYAFSGALIWSMISESIISPINSTNAAKSMITKINFPKEALILSGIYKVIFNSLVKIILVIGFLLFFDVDITWGLILFPIALVGVLIFGTTLGLFITPVGLLYKDVLKAIPIGLQLLMYVTPVVYSVPKEGMMKTLMEYNPFTPMILTTRDLIVGHTPQYLDYYLWIVAISLPLFFLALVFYRVSIPIIVERMSA